MSSACDSSNVLTVIYLAKTILNFITSIIVPIALIIMLAISLTKVVLSGNPDDMKKASKGIISKCIGACCVFFVPLLVNLLMSMLEVDTNSITACYNNATTEYISMRSAAEKAEKELEQKEIEEEKKKAEEERKKIEEDREKIRKERLQKVIDLQLQHTQIQMKARVGKSVKVLVEGVSRDSNEELLGQTEQHEKVAFKADKKLIGSFVMVELVGLSGNTYKGEMKIKN